jgi:hypothetical protein
MNLKKLKRFIPKKNQVGYLIRINDIILTINKNTTKEQIQKIVEEVVREIRFNPDLGIKIESTEGKYE